MIGTKPTPIVFVETDKEKVIRENTAKDDLLTTDIQPATLREVQKSQSVRLLDIVVIGPLLIYAGIAHRKSLPVWLSVSLVAIGAGTIAYNSKNWLRNA